MNTYFDIDDLWTIRMLAQKLLAENKDNKHYSGVSAVQKVAAALRKMKSHFDK